MFVLTKSKPGQSLCCSAQTLQTLQTLQHTIEPTKKQGVQNRLTIADLHHGFTALIGPNVQHGVM